MDEGDAMYSAQNKRRIKNVNHFCCGLKANRRQSLFNEKVMEVKMSKKLLLCSLILFLIPMLLQAGTTGKISGVITDKSSGDPLPGVNVLVDGTTLGASTDMDGFYVILQVPPGSYTVRASYIGYKEFAYQSVGVSADLTTEINFRMEQTTLELGESIVVTAERPMIRKDETNMIDIRSADEIRTMPVRSLNDLASVTAGSVQDEGFVYMRGGRSNETAFIIDGVVQNEQLYGGNRTSLNTNSIEEVQVQTGGFNAEYGGIMSGLVAITTQAGSPQYHFSAEAITDEFLPRNNQDYGAYSYAYNDYNFTLSGPVIPKFDKLTFFGAFQRFYRGDRDPRYGWADGNTYTFVDPYNIPVYAADSTGAMAYSGMRNDTMNVTLDQNIKPGNWENQLNFNGKMRYQLSNNFNIQLSGLMSVIKNQNTNLGNVDNVMDNYYRSLVSHMLINSEHAPRTELNTKSLNLTFTHTLNPVTFYTLKINYYDSFRERGDGQFFNNIYAYGDASSNQYLPIDPETGEVIEGTPLNNTIAQAWHGRGYIWNNYIKDKQTQYAANFDLTRQQGKSHLIKFGGEFRYGTIRWYSLGAYPGVAGLAAPPENFDGSNQQWYELFRNKARADYFGYDFYGNEVNSGDWFENADGSIEQGRPEAPKHPIIAAAYVQDKIEFNDLILNLGARFDYLNPNDWQFIDLAHPYSTGGDPKKFDAADVEDSKVNTFISPRLGFAFPVSENTIFHAQYGKFYQMPRLIDMYGSKNYIDILLLDHPYYDNIGNPNLKPEKTTSYEIGFKQRLGALAALNVTAFYKETADLVRQESYTTDIQDIGFMLNNDYGTVKGIDLNFALRRFKNVTASINYSLSFAIGTGSNSNTLRNIAWLQEDKPKSATPLDYDQRHTGTINLDYRLGKGQGPKVGNMLPFEDFGFNLLFSFNSGRPYTKFIVVSEPFWSGGTGNQPISALNANYSPYNYNLDLKVDKTLRLPFTRGNFNVYLWVVNVLNTKNVVNVYPFTGDVDNNGWLDSNEGLAWQQTASPEEITLYRKRENNPFNYGTPRQIRLGFRFEI